MPVREGHADGAARGEPYDVKGRLDAGSIDDALEIADMLVKGERLARLFRSAGAALVVTQKPEFVPQQRQQFGKGFQAATHFVNGDGGPRTGAVD